MNRGKMVFCIKKDAGRHPIEVCIYKSNLFRKAFYRFALTAFVFLALFPPAYAKVLFETKAKFAILIDVDTNSVLYEKNADSLMAPASMSKLLTLAVIFKELKAGNLKMEETFRISENAWRTGGAPSGTSALMAPLNSEVPLSMLIPGITVQSGNDACIAIAEGMAGSEEAFAGIMTKYARSIGMKKSTFRNSTGLPDPDHMVTARELALLAKHLIQEYPEYYHYFSLKKFKYRRHNFNNRNPLVFSYNADGLKTGFTKESGYGLVASKVDRGRRLIVVVNGLATKRERREEATRLLDWGFKGFREFPLFAKGEIVGFARVWGASRQYVPLTGKADGSVYVVMPRLMNGQKVKAAIVYKGPLKPPIRKGDQVAFLRVKGTETAVNRVPLYAAENVAPAGTLWRGVDTLLFMAFGWLF